MIFIGPSSSAINTLGDKREAKEYLSQHEPSVPLIPGFTGSSSGIQLEDLQVQAERIGLPVMIKASAGGGGKGLRIVRDMSALESEFNRAQSEAQRSFGLSDCIMEKYIEAGKHVEVQIMGDSHGKVISLWERDCSVQRRHQKIIEETPCPVMTPALRQAMGEAALKAGRAVNYVGAGTVEFLLAADGTISFLEVNTRLQVEHPVTEMITGVDLVREQIRIAAGLPLSFTQNDIHFEGHAIEVRINAENPETFTPSPGKITDFHAPGGLGVRLDSAIYAGYSIPPYYDSLIGKLIVHGRDREEAIARLKRSLNEIVIGGVDTTIPLFQKLLQEPDILSGDYDIHWLEKWAARQKGDA